jgi:histidyl-tRNA synthetase
MGVIDRKDKLTPAVFAAELAAATAGKPFTLPTALPDEVRHILGGLIALGVTNAEYDPSIVRGFDYYTGMVFEISDTDPENPRALLGGGRYDNLTALFGGEAITGVGFGIGDVTMHDFLVTHNLLPATVAVTGPMVMMIPLTLEFSLACFALATTLRQEAAVSVATDVSDKKVGKKIKDASDRGSQYVIVVGEDELTQQSFTLRALATGEEVTGPLDQLVSALRAR